MSTNTKKTNSMKKSIRNTKPATANPEPREMTIFSCMSDIVEDLIADITPTDSQFNKAIFSECAEQIEYICKMVGITPNQAVLLSCIIENRGRHHFDKHDLAKYMEMSYIKLLSFDKDFEALADLRLINITKNECISVVNRALKTLAANKKYEAAPVTGLGTAQILKEIRSILFDRAKEEIDFEAAVKDIDNLFAGNPTADIVIKAREAGFVEADIPINERAVFYVMLKRYFYDCDDRISADDFEDVFDDEMDVAILRGDYEGGDLVLQRKKLIEPCFNDGMASGSSFHIPDSLKEELFAEVGGLHSKRKRSTLKVKNPDDITAKKLFYNASEEEQVRRLTNLLQEDNYKATCERLKKSGMRTGFTCLFYGTPGTGKTESVLQIAKATGRGIISVNVSEIKSCWVGESEKLIKGVFDKYRALVRNSAKAPILLFNEADAIFGVRMEGAQRAVDKMENAIQNIILQEMEKLDGILIATTNLTQNLDSAFERRFLYKIRFNKPGLEPKIKIWTEMIPQLKKEQARELAENFDFSGGQIENISRKKMIQEIIDGVEPDFKQLKKFCGEEAIDEKATRRVRVGF